MKTLTYPLTLIILSLFIIGCGSDHRLAPLGSPIELRDAITFRENFVGCTDSDYHIPTAFMFEMVEFDSLLSISGIDKIRFYPAINTHNDTAPDSMTLIMVPVNEISGTDNITNALYEFAMMCPPTCSTTSPYPAPSQGSLGYKMPISWCVNAADIMDIKKQGEMADPGNVVYGIRLYCQPNKDGELDFEFRPTIINGELISDIGDISVSNITTMCWDTVGCCDTGSPLYHAAKSLSK